jgi:hypothetical protein
MWFKKKAYLISSGVVADETAFNTTQSGTTDTNPVTAEPADLNTNWFFLPAAGNCYNGTLGYIGTSGVYWSSTPYSIVFSAYNLNFYSGFANVYYSSRYYGFCLWSVRKLLRTSEAKSVILVNGE